MTYRCWSCGSCTPGRHYTHPCPGDRVYARLDADRSAKPKTIITGRVRPSSTGECTMCVGPGEFYIDLETGRRTSLKEEDQ